MSPMTELHFIPALRTLAIALALAAHIFGASATAAIGGFDPASMLCAPSGKVSAEARAAIEEMLRLAGVEDEDERPAAGHCGACIMIGGALAPQPVLGLIDNALKERRIAFRPFQQTLPSLHGPPLGLRAPPISLTAS